MASGSSFLRSDNAEIGDGKEDSTHVADPDSSSWFLASGLFAANSTEAGSFSYSGKSLRKQMLKRCHLGSNPKFLFRGALTKFTSTPMRLKVYLIVKS